MKKIWAYLTMLLAGFAAGLLVAVRVAGDTYSAQIRRIKQRGSEGSSETVVFKPVLDSSDPKLSKGIDRREKRAQRREKRQNKP